MKSTENILVALALEEKADREENKQAAIDQEDKAAMMLDWDAEQ